MMKVPLKGPGAVVQPDRVFAAMEIDVPIHSNVSAFPKPRRQNADLPMHESLDEDLIRTPPLSTRTPARLRLSVSTKQRPVLMTEAQENAGEDFRLTERRRALFEPLGRKRGLREGSPESLLPPPDFEAASYPRGWVVGKKRKLVNVDVVESMRRIAVHEMNRKDREIDGLNEQLEEDSRTMEHLQLQLQQERQKRLQVERDNRTLQEQVAVLVNMLDEFEEAAEAEHFDGSQVTNT